MGATAAGKKLVVIAKSNCCRDYQQVNYHFVMAVRDAAELQVIARPPLANLT